MRIIILLLAAIPAFAQISTNTVWEVRTTGNDTNGGGFVTGASGTDYSQNDNKNATSCSSCGSSTVNLSKTDLVTAGSTTITSATANFSSAIVGNIVYITGGSASITAAWYQVVTFTNSTTVVVDRSTGLTSGTGATINIGGALATPTQANTNLVSGNNVYVKSGTYTITAKITTGTNITQNSWFGYGTTRGDNGARPLITTSTNSVTIWDWAGGGSGNIDYKFQHISFSSTAGTRGDGFTSSTHVNHIQIVDCIFDGFNIAINGSGLGAPFDFKGLLLVNSEIKNCQSTSQCVVNTSATQVLGCYFHNNAGSALQYIANRIDNTPFSVTNSIFYSNKTGVEVGLSGSDPGYAIGYMVNNTFHSNTTNGVLNHSNSQISISNCIFWNNTTFGIDGAPTGAVQSQGQVLYANAYGSNGTNYRGISAGIGDVTLTADPVTSASGNDFSLNSTAGGGTAAKGAGFPGVLINGGTGHVSIGALMPTTGGGSTGYVSAFTQ